jgi:hydroxymethylpyrimidine pyrophosphatase-like HAD family hydrolase
VLLPPLRPQLIALDMDGTVCDDTNAVPPENIAALRACRAAGIHIAILTGRRRTTLEPVLELLYRECEMEAGPAPAPPTDRPATTPWLLATNSGGLVWEYPGWRMLAAQAMPPALAQAVADALAPHSLNLYVNPAACDGTEIVHLQRAPSAAFDRYFARFSAGTRSLPAASAPDLATLPITQFALPEEDAVVFALAERLRAQFAPDELSVLTMRWPLLDMRGLEAYSPACNKAAALEAIARQLGVPRERTAAAGDDQNDRPMLGWAGSSAAMPHTPDEVAQAAQQRLPGAGVASLAPWLHALAGLPATAADG